MGADALAPPVDRLWALVRTCEKRIAALASRPLWLDVATVVCQHFPVVLYVAWLRQLLIAVCMQQLVQHAERDTKQMQASTSLRPRYPVRCGSATPRALGARAHGALTCSHPIGRPPRARPLAQ